MLLDLCFQGFQRFVTIVTYSTENPYFTGITAISSKMVR